jgi:two-component system nitrate/nitrite response regulator NarL
MTGEVTVLIADDHPRARDAIRAMLEEEPVFRVVGEAGNGLEAIEMHRLHRPQIILMDLHMPVCDGLEATRRIKEADPGVKIVMLTVSDDIKDLFTAVQFGAQGYLLKNMDPDDWLSYLLSLIGMGEQPGVARDFAGRLFYQFLEGGNHPDEPAPSNLTPREKEILGRVAAGETNRQIAEALVITEHTVKNHIKHILEKLQVENRVQLAAYAIRHGIVKK